MGDAERLNAGRREMGNAGNSSLDVVVLVVVLCLLAVITVHAGRRLTGLFEEIPGERIEWVPRSACRGGTCTA